MLTVAVLRTPAAVRHQVMMEQGEQEQQEAGLLDLESLEEEVEMTPNDPPIRPIITTVNLTIHQDSIRLHVYVNYVNAW